ncbi:alpha/beta fold hydrolase [Rathayibacter toxicus]|uniref:alpha/beta fold hydrolase n=1 Tax=Rathayibacter toxicus TaxID=145458 RepID=UPI000CE91869|nr:alpha/beta hydrolase [Rathayibacter toxicus]PPI56239.1 hypothetical protein C5D35_03225 [Rathayibacter toxicus]QOD09964.1 alpha/beta hydrolase [Rathayibacter toxicus]
MSRTTEFRATQAGLVQQITLSISGAPVRLYAAGPQRAPLVLLVTGPGRGAREDTAFLLPLLARRHRVAALELLDVPEPWHEGARAASAALDALDAEEASIVGHALGACVAVATADTDTRVRSVVLAAGWLRPTDRLLLLARLWRNLADHPQARDDLARLITVGSLAALDGTSPWSPDSSPLLAAAAEADVAAAAARLRIPALVIGCSGDTVVGIAGAEALLGAIDDARYAVMDTGHAVLAERPAELLALLERFLADPTRDPAGSIVPRMRV